MSWAIFSRAVMVFIHAAAVASSVLFMGGEGLRAAAAALRGAVLAVLFVTGVVGGRACAARKAAAARQIATAASRPLIFWRPVRRLGSPASCGAAGWPVFALRAATPGFPCCSC